jgi:hypothetical protein
MGSRPEVGDSSYSIIDNSSDGFNSTDILIESIGNFRSDTYYGVIISERDEEIIVKPYENSDKNFGKRPLKPSNPLYDYYNQMLLTVPLDLTIWRFGTSFDYQKFSKKYKIIHKGTPFAFLPYQESYYYPDYFIGNIFYNGNIKTFSDHLVINSLYNQKRGYLSKGLNILPKLLMKRL